MTDSDRNGTSEAWQRMPVSSQLHNKKGQFTEKTEAGNIVRSCWNFQVIYLFCPTTITTTT